MAVLLAQETGSVFMVAGALIAIVIGLVIFAIFARYFTLWIQCVTTGAGIGIWDLIGMTFRSSPSRANPD